ncbi:disease resistance protein rpm1 [Phtheirospermum japonicum]|uniref:Disease resistance protein rpm1 n=1 Tax=Phtheirospermum japonicum TaxID=374723 RepID=A0A830CB82_9LAMI|nr:disease resistance protein rpm1 [Phtheirospermum japonicum]
MFPEGCVLEKWKIIRLWVAEGFVQVKQGKTMEEVAESYLNEILSRSLIQVADKAIDGRPTTFRVHDLLREYISSKSREQNIVSILHGGEMKWPNKIRRLVIQKPLGFIQEKYSSFKYLRTLILVGVEYRDLRAIKELVEKCKLLKVLNLEGAPLETIPDEVFKLFHLKHLSLRKTMVKIIPKSIKNLQNLETLDLKHTDVTKLPIEILRLRKLRHLLVYKYEDILDASFYKLQGAKAPCDIGDYLLSLQKLSCIDADEVGGVKIVKEIGKLTQLRRLGIAKLRKADGMELCSSIAKLTNLRSLYISAAEEGEMLDLDYHSSSSSLNLAFLRTLNLRGCLEKVPEWVS